jgi:hypothetical protein
VGVCESAAPVKGYGELGRRENEFGVVPTFGFRKCGLNESFADAAISRGWEDI